MMESSFELANICAQDPEVISLWILPTGVFLLELRSSIHTRSEKVLPKF